MKSVTFKLFQTIKKYKMQFIFSLACMAAMVLIELYIPILVADSIDFMLGKNHVNFAQIYELVRKIATFTILVFVLQWVTSVQNHKIIYNISKDLRNNVLQKLKKIPLQYLDSKSHGDIVSRVISDVDQVSDGLLLGFAQIFSGSLTILLTVFFMFSINNKMAWLVIILSPLSLLVAKYISKKTYHLFKQQSKMRGTETAFLNEMITNQKTVIAFGQQENNIQKFNKINDDLEQVSVKAVFFSSITNPSTRFVNNIIYAIVTFFGAFIAMTGNLTVGGLTCFLSYANQYTKPFNEISGVLTELQNAIACFERICEILEAEEEVKEKNRKLEKIEGEINLKNVNFGYVKGKTLIKNMSFYVEPGKKVAIVGPTGCGKTTLINLLMRFYEINSGAIEIDGKNSTDVTRKTLRKSFGMVLQDSWIKNGSIRENIKLGKPDATEEEIINAAQKSMSYSFIKRLPKGLDTIVQNQDGRLSEGERQLISIARIMLLDPPMLILDEATSNIDTRTEAKIQEAFDRLMQGRTSFIVAHRLSTIMSADIILVMREGEIIEKGTHEELVEKNGFYAELYKSQFEGL